MFGGNDYGGFMANNASGFSPSADRKTGGRTQGRQGKFYQIVPITAETFGTLQSPELKMGTYDIKLVSLVGEIVSVERGGLWFDYMLRDASSERPVPVRQWLNNDENSGTSETPMEGSVVHVYGHIKDHEGSIRIFSTSIRPVLDPVNEPRAHLLEAKLASLYYMKDMPVRLQGETNGASSSMFARQGAGASASFESQHAGGAAFSSGGGTTAGFIPGGGGGGGAKSLDEQVYAIVRSAAKEYSGISIQDVHSRFPRCSLNQIRSSLEGMCNEGYLFTTTDDDHFQVTDGAK